jgi:apolipoprotein N-acyltransferase
LLIVLSRGSLLVLLALLLFAETRLSNPLRLIRTFTEVCLLPAIAAWLLARSLRTTVEVSEKTLVIDLRRRRIEVPCESVAAVEQWSVPLPSAGIRLTLKSGRRFSHGLGVADVAAARNAIVEAADLPQVGMTPHGAAAQYARAAAAGVLHRTHPILRYVVFALVPALPLFRLHQWITYGGTFGEYYMYGLGPYMLALAVYWAHAAIWLMMIDAALAAIGLGATIATALAAPSRTAVVGKAARATGDILYYASVPTFLLRLFLQS